MRQIEASVDAYINKRIVVLVARIGIKSVKRRLRIVTAVLITGSLSVPVAEALLIHHIGRPFWEGAVAGLFSLLVGIPVGTVLGKKKRSSQNAAAPKLPMRYLFCFLLPKKVREPLLGDVEEEYQEIRVEYGERTAKLWYYKQLVALIWPTLQMSGRTLAKWGIVGWLEEMIRRIAH